MKKYSLRALQLAYMAEMEFKNETPNEETCVFCWKKDCGCSTKTTVKNDLFLNFTGEELQYV